MIIIMYFLPDLEEGNESETPSRHELGPMGTPFVLYLGQKLG